MQERRTILFADVSGSTSIIETVGNSEGREFISGILDELARVTEMSRGQVIKTIGDEVLSCFLEPLDAMVAAVEMQRAVGELPSLGAVRPRIKVGLHEGPVIMEDGDIYGDVVNVAARVIGLAEPNQILTTAHTLAALGDTPIPTRSLGEHTVKGKGEPILFCEVLWEENPDQLTALAPKRKEKPPAQLEVRLGASSLSMSGAGGEVQSLGRGDASALVVADESASRSHADIVARGGRFYLADHSTNGTYVRPDGGDEIFVHRDEVLLRGLGAIRLGRVFSDPDGPTLEYRVF